MCAPTVHYMQLNCGLATENLAFECDKSFSVATTNLSQQNTCMTSGIVFVTIPYCTIYYSRNPLLCVPIGKVFLDYL